jgi:hypothetical protein
VLVWFVLSWALSVAADRTSSSFLEATLAAISPLAFGLLVPVVVTVLVYFLLGRNVQTR